MKVNDTRSPSSLKTTDRIFRIVETLQEMDGARVSELAERLDMANSTVHRYLQALRANEYVVQEGDIYYIGSRFLALGDYVQNRKELYRLAKPKVKQIAEETDERGEFLAEEFGRAVFIHRHIGSNAIRADSHLGKRLPMHATSAGKAMLANMPADRAEAILDAKGLERFTEETVTDRERLTDELETIRDEGVAFNYGEYIEGMHTVSVPVFDDNDRIAGALGVSGPAHRLKGDRLHEEIPDLLLGTANELEINISYQ